MPKFYFNEYEFNLWKEKMCEKHREELLENGEDLSNFWTNAFTDFINEGRKMFFEEVEEDED